MNFSKAMNQSRVCKYNYYYFMHIKQQLLCNALTCTIIIYEKIVHKLEIGRYVVHLLYRYLILEQVSWLWYKKNSKWKKLKTLYPFAIKRWECCKCKKAIIWWTMEYSTDTVILWFWVDGTTTLINPMWDLLICTTHFHGGKICYSNTTNIPT